MEKNECFLLFILFAPLFLVWFIFNSNCTWIIFNLNQSHGAVWSCPSNIHSICDIWDKSTVLYASQIIWESSLIYELIWSVLHHIRIRMSFYCSLACVCVFVCVYMCVKWPMSVCFNDSNDMPNQVQSIQSCCDSFPWWT